MKFCYCYSSEVFISLGQWDGPDVGVAAVRSCPSADSWSAHSPTAEPPLGFPPESTPRRRSVRLCMLSPRIREGLAARGGGRGRASWSESHRMKRPRFRSPAVIRRKVPVHLLWSGSVCWSADGGAAHQLVLRSPLLYLLDIIVWVIKLFIFVTEVITKYLVEDPLIDGLISGWIAALLNVSLILEFLFYNKSQ